MPAPLYPLRLGGVDRHLLGRAGHMYPANPPPFRRWLVAISRIWGILQCIRDLVWDLLNGGRGLWDLLDGNGELLELLKLSELVS